MVESAKGWSSTLESSWECPCEASKLHRHLSAFGTKLCFWNQRFETAKSISKSKALSFESNAHYKHYRHYTYHIHIVSCLVPAWLSLHSPRPIEATKHQGETNCRRGKVYNWMLLVWNSVCYLNFPYLQAIRFTSFWHACKKLPGGWGKSVDFAIISDNLNRLVTCYALHRFAQLFEVLVDVRVGHIELNNNLWRVRLSETKILPRQEDDSEDSPCFLLFFPQCSTSRWTHGRRSEVERNRENKE